MHHNTMHLFLWIDWDSAFVPTASVWEYVLRGSIVYLFLFLLFRMLRREAGGLSITDVLYVVLVAEAASNAMVGESKSVTEGLILVGTIAFWNYFLDWLNYRFPGLRPYLDPPALPLIKNGKMLRQNMKKELITEDELLGQLREQGVEEVQEVKWCYLEGDGQISVIKFKSEEQNSNKKKQRIMN
jgi:uncharacterized membrane protein YcaP (DUF421 family)